MFFVSLRLPKLPGGNFSFQLSDFISQSLGSMASFTYHIIKIRPQI